MVKRITLFLSILTYFLLGLKSNTNAQTVYVSGLRACVGDTVTVPFGVLNGQGLAAISLNLQIPSSGLQYLGTDSLHADVSSAVFSVNSANLWAFAWYSLNPVNLNGPMGLLRFRVLAPITDTLRWDPSNSELADYTATPITSTIYQDGGFFAGTPSSVTSLSATICQGLQYLVGNQSFGATGLYSVSLTNVEGCDSLVHLNLTVIPADTTRILRVLCSGESTNILGVSYSSHTVVYQNVPTSQGCDSMVEYRVEMMTNQVTSSGLCVGSTLTGSTNVGDVVRAQWKRNGAIIKTELPTYGPTYETIMGGMFTNSTDVFYHNATGDIYISDAGSHRVVKITPGSSTPVVVAGGNGAGSASNQLSSPQGIFVTNNGTLFVADPGNQRVQRWLPGAPSGTTVAGGHGAGSLSRQLNAPYDVTIDTQGRLYVSDYNNHRIMRWNPGATSGTVYRTVNHPWGIQLMGNGDLYVAEHHGHLVRLFPANTTTSTVVATNNTGGCHPTFFAVNERREIFLNWAHCNYHVTRYVSDSTQGVRLFNTGTQGIGIAIDANGSLLVGQYHGFAQLLRYTPNSISGLSLETQVPGTYHLEMLRGSGCALSSNSVDVYQAVSQVSSDKGQQICYGDTATLSVVPQPGYSYQWTKDGQDLAGFTGTSLVISDPGSYRLRATENHGCVWVSDSFVVAPPAQSQLSAVGNCVGDSILFTTSDSTVNTIRWFIDGVFSGQSVADYDGGEIVANGFRHPTGLFCDANGNMFIADNHNQRVVRWNLNQSSGVNLLAGHGSALNQVNYPQGLHVDRDGSVYVADHSNHRILKYVPGISNAQVVAGGTQGGGLSQLNYPTAVRVATNGDLYILDRDNARILRWSPGAASGVVVAGTNVAGSGASQLFNPIDLILMEDGSMIVSDQGNHRIQRFAAGSTIGQTIAGGNGSGNALNQLNNPVGIVMDVNMNLFIADYSNQRILVWPQGGSQGTVLANSNVVVNPHNLAFAPDGSLLVTDHFGGMDVKRFRMNFLGGKKFRADFNGTYTAQAYNRLGCRLQVSGSVVVNSPAFEISSSGGDLLCAGDTTTLSVTTNGMYSFQWLMNGQMIAGATGTRLLIHEPGRYRVRVTNSQGCITESQEYNVLDVPSVNITSNGACGHQAAITLNTTDSLVAGVNWFKSGTIAGYQGVRYEPIGDLESNAYPYPSQVLLGRDGKDLYVSQHNQIWKKDLESGRVEIVAGLGGGGTMSNQLNNPQGFFVDHHHNIYIADASNHRVMRYDSASTVGVVVAGGNGPGSDSTQLNHPFDTWVDNLGNLYVLDHSNHRIQRWSPGANHGVTVAGGNGGGAALNQLYNPTKMVMGENGWIYIADHSNHRIVRWRPGNSSSILVAGGNGAGNARNQLNHPRSLCFDLTGALYVTDQNNHRVIRFRPGSSESELVVGGQGQGGASVQLNFPTGIAIESNGKIYIADNHNHRVMKYNHYGIDSAVYRPARGGDYQARVYFRNGCYSESNSVHVGNIDTAILGNSSICQGQTLQVGTQALSTPGYHEVLLTNADGCDSLVQVYLVVKPISRTNLTAAICAGQSYTFGNQILTSSGTYVNNLSNSVDCDSVVTLNLTVQQPTTNQVSAFVCSPSTYSFGGQMLNQSGTYVHTYASFAGCDSTVTLHLTVRQIGQTNLSAAICQGQTYSFGPQTLTSSGQYMQNLTASNGCDSVVSLDLMVRPTYTIPMFQRICSGSSYLFGNQVITTTGQYVRQLTSGAGCDSVIILDLVVGTPSSVTILNEVICSPSSFAVGTQSFSTSGQYNVTLTDQSGCDSVVQLNLDVRQPSSHIISATTTGAQFVMVGNQYFNRTGQYTVILTNHRGCDSVITLNLTSIPIQVRASNLTVCNGDTISVPVVVENAMGVSAVSLTLNYPGQNLSYFGYDQVNPSLSTANLLLNATSVNGNQQVRISWYDLNPVNISSGTLISLRFVVTNPSFNALEWDLAIPGMCEFADEFGDSVPNMIYSNGLIHAGGSFVQWAETICQGQSYAFDGNSLSSSGVYTAIHPDYVGCDSVVVLNLTVNPTSATTLYDTIPIESSYWLGGQAFTHTGVYQVVFQNQFGCDSTVTLHLKVLGYPLSGRLLYNNTAQTPMTNTTVRLKQNGQVVHTSSTNGAGQFAFGPVDSNTYQLEFVHNKPWGGVNATDALGISRHFTNVLPLVGFRLQAGDVNLSNQVNTSDALLVTRRYSNLLGSFPSGNWAYSSTGFHIGPREDLFLDLKALCYGDVNGSYNPSVTARASWTRMEENGDQATNSGVYFLDLKAKRGMDLGAVSLNLRLPEGVQVVSVRSMSKVSDEAVVYKQQGRSLRLAWYHLMPWRLMEGDDVIRLELKGRAEGWLEMDETESELANSDGVALTGLPLTAARLRLQSSKAPLEASIFPNPASNRSSLNLNLGQPSTLRVEVVDAIGRRVYQSHDPMLSAGEHRLELPMDEWSDGQYYVLVQALTGDGQVLKQSLKLQKKR